MLGGPERINAEPAHSHLTVLVVRSGRSMVDIMHVASSRVRDRFTIVGFGISGAPMLGTGASPTLFCVGVYVKTVTHTLELDPGARWSAGRVRVYGTHGPRRSHYESTTHYGYPGAVQVARQTPARPARNHGGVRGAGPNPQSRKREAKPQCTVAPNPIPTVHRNLTERRHARARQTK